MTRPGRIRQQTMWTDKDADQLRAEFSNCSRIADLAKRLGRTLKSVEGKAEQMGLLRSKAAINLAISVGRSGIPSGPPKVKKAPKKSRATPAIEQPILPLANASIDDLQRAWR